MTVRLLLFAISLTSAAWPALGAPAQAAIEDAIVRESAPGPAPQITTAQLRDTLSRGGAVLLDARPADEFAMSHIPGALNVAQKPGTPMSLYISDVAEVKRLVSDRNRMLIVYCNGPYCGKSRRLAEELAAAGYTNVRRYQLGMHGWRTVGGVASVAASAIHRVAELDRTAVFIDAGLPSDTRPFSRMASVRVEQVTEAKDDGRLPMTDHNTRIIVIGSSGSQAREVAAAIAANAFHNVAYFDGDGATLHYVSR